MIATIDYTNYRGERAERTIRPFGIQHMVSEWHGEEAQWILLAEDVAKPGVREFAMRDIHAFRNVDSEPDDSGDLFNQPGGDAAMSDKDARARMREALEMVSQYHERYRDRVGAADGWARQLQDVVRDAISADDAERDPAPD